MSDQNIDKKLRKILETNFAAGVHNDDPRYESHIAQIKQAFADESYIQIPRVQLNRNFDGVTQIKVNSKDLFMTGQSWYDKFEKEYLSLLSPGQMHADDLTEEDVLEAAKRASGINS